jgi:predicted metal-dependent hydrolase
METFRLIRSKRKSISLEIAPDAELIVRAPFFVDDAAVGKVVVQKRDWILRKQRQVLQRDPAVPAREFKDGEEFFYLGRQYALSLREKLIPSLFFENGFLLARDYCYRARDLFIQWYTRQARLYIPGRVGVFCSRGNVRCAGVSIRNTGSRWGSCGRNGKLNFSCRLMMAPPEIIDYVVAHEVAHLAVMNHSKNFWRKVRDIFPAYGECRRWLRENGHRLVI